MLRSHMAAHLVPPDDGHRLIRQVEMWRVGPVANDSFQSEEQQVARSNLPMHAGRYGQ